MGCLISNIKNLQYLNDDCGFIVSGIRQLYVANFDKDIYNSMIISGNTITDITKSIKFVELEFNFGFSKYSEVYNYGDKKYEQNLDVELNKFDPSKKDIIDSLIKAKLIFIIKDNNGKYFIMGDNSGAYSTAYSAGTDILGSGRSNYLFKFFTKSDYGLLEVSSSYVASNILPVDCNDLDGEFALSTLLDITIYQDCIIVVTPIESEIDVQIENLTAVFDGGNTTTISFDSITETGLVSYFIERFNINTGSIDRTNIVVSPTGNGSNYSVLDDEIFESYTVYTHTLKAILFNYTQITLGTAIPTL